MDSRDYEPAGRDNLKPLALAVVAVVGLVGLTLAAVSLDIFAPGSRPLAAVSPSPTAADDPASSPTGALETTDPATATPSTPVSPASPATAAPASTSSPSAAPTGAPTADAETQAGDELTTAIVISRLPFEREFRRFNVTGNRTDPQCFAGDADGPDRTIWYSITPRRERTLAAVAYGLEVYVGTVGRNGRFNLIDCGSENMRGEDGLASGVVFDADAGVTYLIMLRAYEFDGWREFYGHFLLFETSRPPDVSFSINRRGTVDLDGTAHISGTVTCSHEDAFSWADVEGWAQQSEDVYASIYEEWDWLCNERETRWRMRLECEDCLFTDGPLDVVLHGRFDDGVDLKYFDAERTVTLEWSGATPSPEHVAPTRPATAPPTEPPADPPIGDPSPFPTD